MCKAQITLLFFVNQLMYEAQFELLLFFSLTNLHYRLGNCFLHP